MKYQKLKNYEELRNNSFINIYKLMQIRYLKICIKLLCHPMFASYKYFQEIQSEVLLKN